MTELEENQALSEYKSLRANQTNEEFDRSIDQFIETNSEAFRGVDMQEYLDQVRERDPELPKIKHVHEYRKMKDHERNDNLIFVCSRYICDGCGDQCNM